MKAFSKSILALSVLAAYSVCATAQNMYDAINISRNDYFGTARTVALGNAVTALGGDLGTIGINPAGSAVYSYSQVTVTPGIAVSSIRSSYDAGNSWVSDNTSSRTKVTMPNAGVSVVFNTGRSSGLKSFTVAFVSNQTAQYLSYANVYGVNSATSKLAEMAAAAYGIDEGALGNFKSYDGNGIAWDILTGYQAGMFGSYGTNGQYVAVTEALNGNNHYVPGKLAQTSITQKGGSKKDVVLNMGFNVSDKFYFGFNLGLPKAMYEYNEIFYESAMDPSQFLLTFNKADGKAYDTYFKSASTNYKYVSDTEGVYAKFGFIYKPLSTLRLGAAIQTPASYTITENWQYAANTIFDDNYFNGSQTSPTGKYSYRLRSPYVISFGAATTFTKFGLLSIDYELMDYSVMQFSEIHNDYLARDSFYDLNETNRNFAGVSRNIRIGLEARLTSEFSMRFGLSSLTSPERYWTNDRGESVYADDFLADFDSYTSNAKRLVSSHYTKDNTFSGSIGFGYASSSSFFADVAVKYTRYPKTRFYPYYDYPNWNADGDLVNAASPVITNNRSLISALFTFGWRF